MSIDFSTCSSPEAAAEGLRYILGDSCSDEERLKALQQLDEESITATIFRGFLTELSSRKTPVTISKPILFDVCGTGGDGKSTLNISTAVAFVLAGLGIFVAKHGNRGATSRVGSSQVLEALGVPFAKSSLEAEAHISEAGLCFLHAPHFQPALATLAAARKQYGKPTIFNLLGPLLNPAPVTHQLIGVKSLRVLGLYGNVLAHSMSQKTLVHTRGGYDEVSLTDISWVHSNASESQVAAADFGFEVVAASALVQDGDADKAALLLESLLQGKARRELANVVAANTALCLKMLRPKESLATLASEALDAIYSGKGYKPLSTLRAYESSR